LTVPLDKDQLRYDSLGGVFINRKWSPALCWCPLWRAQRTQGRRRAMSQTDPKL